MEEVSRFDASSPQVFPSAAHCDSDEANKANGLVDGLVDGRRPVKRRYNGVIIYFLIQFPVSGPAVCTVELHNL